MSIGGGTSEENKLLFAFVGVIEDTPRVVSCNCCKVEGKALLIVAKSKGGIMRWDNVLACGRIIRN